MHCRALVLLCAWSALGLSCSDDSSATGIDGAADGAVADSHGHSQTLDAGPAADQWFDRYDTVSPDLAGLSCTQIASWPGINPTGGYDAFPSLTYAESAQAAGTPFTMLRVEDFHFDPAPKTVQVDATWRSVDCDVCAFVAEGCADSFASCQKVFFVQAGSITITQADEQGTGGRMIASTSQLRLVEWDEVQDLPLPNGGCYEIGSASFDVTW